MDGRAEVADKHPHEVTPQRSEVMALVEHERPDPARDERADPLAGCGRDDRREVDVDVLAASDRALQPRHLVGDVLLEPLLGRAPEAGHLAGDLVGRRPRRLRALRDKRRERSVP